MSNAKGGSQSEDLDDANELPSEITSISEREMDQIDEREDSQMEHGHPAQERALQRIKTRARMRTPSKGAKTPPWQLECLDFGPQHPKHERLPVSEINRGKELRGNSTLHCVLVHEQTEMLRHLVEVWGADMHLKNDQGFNVLDYSCLLGSSEVTSECLQLGARLVWEWGPVQCKQYDLEDLFVALVICIQHGRGELLQLEQFNILLNDMWESYAFKSYFVYFLHHVMQCVLLTFLVPWWSNVDALSTLRWLLLVLVPSSGLGLVEDSYTTVRMHAWKPKFPSCNPMTWHIYPASPELVVNLGFSVVYAVSLVASIHTVGFEDKTRWALTGLACFVAWFRCVNYLRMSELCGPFVISIGTIFTDVLFKWLLVSLFCFLGFMCLLASIIDVGEITDDTMLLGVANHSSSMTVERKFWSDYFLCLFSALIGEPDFGFFEDHALHFDQISTFIYVLYTFTSSLILINMLIAMLTKMADKIQDDALTTYRLAWGRGILGYSLLPSLMGRPRPHHHITVDRYDARGPRWMMMLEEFRGAVAPRHALATSSRKRESAVARDPKLEQLYEKLEKMEGMMARLTTRVEAEGVPSSAGNSGLSAGPASISVTLSAKSHVAPQHPAPGPTIGVCAAIGRSSRDKSLRTARGRNPSRSRLVVTARRSESP